MQSAWLRQKSGEAMGELIFYVYAQVCFYMPNFLVFGNFGIVYRKNFARYA